MRFVRLGDERWVTAFDDLSGTCRMKGEIETSRFPETSLFHYSSYNDVFRIQAPSERPWAISQPSLKSC